MHLICRFTDDMKSFTENSEAEARNLRPIIKTVLEGLNCPFETSPNYKYIDGKCFYMESTKLSFEKAQRNCQDKFGSEWVGRLIEPKGDKDKIMADLGTKNTWIGAVDRLSRWNPDQFYYVSDSQPVYLTDMDFVTKGHDEHCLCYRHNVSYFRARLSCDYENCNAELPSVCEAAKKDKDDVKVTDKKVSDEVK